MVAQNRCRLSLTACYGQAVDAGIWVAAGSAAALLTAGVASWQLRLELLKKRARAEDQARRDDAFYSAVAGLPVAPPVGQLPTKVCGREALLTELRRQMSVRKGCVWVLAGMGGVGKSTVALAAAKSAIDKGWRVWWINAADGATLTGCIVEMLHQLNAPASVTEAVRSGAPTAAERTWRFLSNVGAAKRALLIFDSADDPAILAGSAAANPAAGTGWLRPAHGKMMVVVTTRYKDREAWGQAITFREMRPLSDEASAEVLADLDPLVADSSGREALELGRRLGGLPLALHLAGNYLRSPFAEVRSFADFRAALDGSPHAMMNHDDPGDQVRAALQQTWNLSLEALAEGGRPQSRQLLYLLCCYSPATPIPLSLFHAQLLQCLLCPDHSGVAAGGEPLNYLPRRLRDGWQALSEVGLIDVVTRVSGSVSTTALSVHLLVADVNRSLLLSTAESDLPPISQAAIGLLQIAANELDLRLPADWPAWRELAPHVAAVLGWLANHLDRGTLVTLLGISDNTARAILRSGSIALADSLVNSEVAAAGTLGDEHPAYLAARCSQATMMRWQGNYAAAEKLYDQVLAVQQQVLGDAHPDTLRTRHNLAWGMAYQERYAEAELVHRQVLADRRRVLGDDHPDTLDTRLRLAQVIAKQDRYEEAERLYQELIIDQRRVLGSDHPDTLDARHALAEVIAAQRKHEDAERLHRHVLADRQKLLGSEHPETLESGHALAEVIAAQSRHKEAELLHRQVLTDRQRLLGRDHPDTLQSQNSLSAVIAAQTDTKKARG
jgi:tetratricopeptide (TPR) repeat protein